MVRQAGVRIGIAKQFVEAKVAIDVTSSQRSQKIKTLLQEVDNIYFLASDSDGHQLLHSLDVSGTFATPLNAQSHTTVSLPATSDFLCWQPSSEARYRLPLVRAASFRQRERGKKGERERNLIINFLPFNAPCHSSTSLIPASTRPPRGPVIVTFLFPLMTIGNPACSSSTGDKVLLWLIQAILTLLLIIAFLFFTNYTFTNPFLSSPKNKKKNHGH